jgi:hypothetical protein
MDEHGDRVQRLSVLAPAVADPDDRPRTRIRRMALSLGLAAVFVVVIPVSVQEEGGWQLPGFGSQHRPTPGPTRTVPVVAGTAAVTTVGTPTGQGR